MINLKLAGHFKIYNQIYDKSGGNVLESYLKR